MKIDGKEYDYDYYAETTGEQICHVMIFNFFFYFNLWWYAASPRGAFIQAKWLIYIDL